MHTKTATAAVTVSGVPLAITGDTAQALLSVALGLSGVALARTVFINKERRRTGQVQPMRETLPLTLTAMLVTGVVIWDKQFGPSLSVFTGLGVGWTAILLLDVIGAWLLKTGRRIAGVTPEELGIPRDQIRLLKRLDDPPEHMYEDPRGDDR
jgi:hypothetical protein